jgi:hypothetical protein
VPNAVDENHAHHGDADDNPTIKKAWGPDHTQPSLSSPGRSEDTAAGAPFSRSFGKVALRRSSIISVGETHCPFAQCFQSDPFGVRGRGDTYPFRSAELTSRPAHPRWVPHFSSRLRSATTAFSTKTGTVSSKKFKSALRAPFPNSPVHKCAFCSWTIMSPKKSGNSWP